MSVILCIESSADICSVAIKNKHGQVHFKESEKKGNHSENISRLISECLKESEVLMTDLQAVAISDGPGSYTGLRIGASTAKGICFGLGIPLIAVNTLKSLASGYLKADREYKGLIWPMIDARRMEVYHSVFDAQLSSLMPVTNWIIEKENVHSTLLNREIVLCGDGAFKAEAILGLPNVNLVQHARHLCDIAEQSFQANAFVDLRTYQPFYLKLANITKPANK